MNREIWSALSFLKLRKALPLLLTLAVCLSSAAGDRDAARDRALADALFTNGSLLHLKLELPASNIAALAKAPHQYVTGTLREGDTAYPDIGIHLKGSLGSFRPINSDRPGFTLKLDYLEDHDTAFHGVRKFHLNNCAQDPTALSDWLANEIFRQSGVPAPRCAHALVELNGRRLGLYVLMESCDRDFLAHYFKNTKGNLYGQSGHGDVASDLERMGGKGPLDRADLKALTAACRDPNPTSRWDRVQKTLDLDRFLSFMAVETMLCDWDGYVAAQHNYRVYQDLDTSGRMVFMPHDKDQILGNPGHPYMPASGSLVAQFVLNNPQARHMYRERFGLLFTNVLKPDLLNARIDWIVGKLSPGIQAWDRNYLPAFVNNANGLKNRVTARARGLEGQFRPPPPKPVIAAVPKPANPNPPPHKAAVDATPQPKPAAQASTSHHPAPDPLKAQWEPIQAQNASKLAKLEMDQKPVLYIKSEQTNSVGAWRANLQLPPGTYRFSGRAKTRGLAPQTTKLGAGGGLRISGRNRTNILQGDQDWTTLQEEFNVPAQGPVRLLCELRANKGEIWFDLASLKLERVK